MAMLMSTLMLLTTCRTLKKDCPFHITLSASKDGRHLVVSLMNTRHENHEVSDVVDNVTVKPPLQAKTDATGDILSLVSSGHVGTVESVGSQSLITIGDRFCSFAEVEARLAAFSKATFTQLCMRDALTISAAAKRSLKRAAVLNPDLKYYNVKYCCIHGGRTFQPEGQGHRQIS